MIKYFLFLGIFLFKAYPSIGKSEQKESYTLRGEVTDAGYNPLEGATVRILPANKFAIAGDDGKFRISDIPSGRYQIEVKFLGFETFRTEVNILADFSVTFRLTEQMQNLQEVVIADNYAQKRNQEESLTVEVVNDVFLKQNWVAVLCSRLKDYLVLVLLKSVQVSRNLSYADWPLTGW